MKANYRLLILSLVILVVLTDRPDCNGTDEPIMTGTAASFQEEPPPSENFPVENPQPEPAEAEPPQAAPLQIKNGQGVQVIETDVATFILNANPVCSEADKKPNGYAKDLTSTGCGKQVRLQSWTCTKTGEEGWTAEVYELEPCR